MHREKLLAVARCPKRWVVFLLSCLVVALFYPGVNGGFILDDKPNITQNIALYVKGLDHISLWRAASSFHGGAGLRSVAMLSFGLDYFRADAFDPAAYKATNIAIHAITFAALTGFLFLILSISGWHKNRAFWCALAMALVWAIHPLQVSSVLYVVQRMQTLATLFTVLAMCWYLKMRQAQINGDQGWREGRWMLLFAFLAIASKEDAVLLPLYCLILEWTVLSFRAASPATHKIFVWAYCILISALALVFFLWGIPHYWHLETFPGRDFNSYERVLTQGRVLAMYLSQIMWPAPDMMPFYYDDYIASRGWLNPESTIFSWAFILTLIVAAWACRRRHPLISIGIFWFFCGHLITSNIIGLELAFEHRNHFPIIGIILAVVGFLDAAQSAIHTHSYKLFMTAGCALTLTVLGFNSSQRIAVWSNKQLLAEKSVEIAPKSSRAWVALCLAHYESSRGIPESSEFDKAINVCQNGGKIAGSAMALANAVIFKTIRGDIQQTDWDLLLDRLRQVTMTPENIAIAMNMVGNANHGIALSPDQVLATVEIVRQRGYFSPTQYVSIARFVLDHTTQPAMAYQYLEQAVLQAPINAPMIPLLMDGLRAEKLDEWAGKLEALRKNKVKGLKNQDNSAVS